MALSLTRFFSHCIIIVALFHSALTGTKIKADFGWAIVGAGPAGVLAVGLLHDFGVDYSSIVWIDPEFSVGRMGAFYRNVPANSTPREMSALMKSIESFAPCITPSIELLHTYPADQELVLKIVADALQDITYFLFKQGIIHKKGLVKKIDFADSFWKLNIDGFWYTAEHVILATGAEPCELEYPVKEVIPLDYALDKQYLENTVLQDDTIAVVGSGASAILLLKHLSEIPVKQVINFYKHHHKEARKKSLIRGSTAQWISEVLDKAPPKNLLRVSNTPENRALYLPQCNKIIYATGYKRSNFPEICGPHEIPKPNKTGILGPRLFGFGFAYPQELSYHSAQGMVIIPLVGLSSFAHFARKVMPDWIKMQ